MIFYFTDVVDVMVTTDFYVHDPMTDDENCGCLIGKSVDDVFQFWITADSFEYLREGLLSGKEQFLLDPTERLHKGDENSPVYEIVQDD